ncbi:hypothetical protein AYK24_08385 [Thermoplasmatales archaeon SG8-52-4]|nr:MAG: hypothetical protein AYK24_08385 [Thermoplasmatales archaeon SG8-52-4]
MIAIYIQRIRYQDYKYEFTKPNGKEFKTNLHILGKVIRRMHQGFSPIIMVCGGQRMGKSFVTIWLSNLIMHFFHSRDYPVKTNTFYDPIESIKIITTSDQQPIVIDEAGAFLNKTEWYDRVVKAMDKIIQTQGYKSNCYIFISPFGSDIAKTFRKHFDFQIYVRKKGIVVVRQIPKKYDSFKDIPVKPFRLEQIRIMKSNLKPELWEEYEKFSFAMKDKIAKEQYAKGKGQKKDYFGRSMGVVTL